MIGEPFAATRPFPVGRGLDRSLEVGGITLTSAPVSIRNWAPEMGSRMWRRIDVAWLFGSAVNGSLAQTPPGWLAVKRLFIGISPDRVGSFPNLILVSGWSPSGHLVQSMSMAIRISWPWMRIWYGKSIAFCPERSPVGHVTTRPDRKWSATNGSLAQTPPEMPSLLGLLRSSHPLTGSTCLLLLPKLQGLLWRILFSWSGPDWCGLGLGAALKTVPGTGNQALHPLGPNLTWLLSTGMGSDPLARPS